MLLSVQCNFSTGPVLRDSKRFLFRAVDDLTCVNGLDHRSALFFLLPSNGGACDGVYDDDDDVSVHSVMDPLSLMLAEAIKIRLLD